VEETRRIETTQEPKDGEAGEIVSITFKDKAAEATIICRPNARRSLCSQRILQVGAVYIAARQLWQMKMMKESEMKTDVSVPEIQRGDIKIFITVFAVFFPLCWLCF